MMNKELEVNSPCISVCAMDDVHGVCVGCYRTLSEIESWWDFDNAHKKAVLEKARLREEAMFDN
jgi:hypothetical protein